MAINDYFKQYLGRDVTPDESAYFDKYLSQGYLQPYEVGQIIQSTPEYQQRLFQQQIPQLQQMLGANDERMLGQAGDALARRFYQQGRGTTGSAYTQAYMNSARDLAAQRQNQLAQFYTGNFGNQANIALQQGQGAQQRGYGLADAYRQREWDIQDYNRAKSDYDNYLNQFNRQQRNRSIGGLIGSGVGLIGGIASGNPMMGMQIGSTFGSGLGGL